MPPNVPERPNLYTHLSYQQGSTVSESEPLLVGQGVRSIPFVAKRPPKRRLLLLISTGLLLTSCVLAWGRWRASPPKSNQIIPTLFEIKDPDTHEYVVALDNPLYGELGASNAHYIAGVNTYALPQLEVSKEYLEPKNSLLVSWRDIGQHFRYEKDIMAVYCDGNLVEAATLFQIDMFEEAAWFIPSIPRIMYQQCQFCILQAIRHAWWSQKVQYHVVASSAVLPITKTDQPHSIHIALTQSPAELVFQFVTTQSGTPLVVIGDRKFQGTSTTYTASDMCAAPANTTGPGKFSPPGQLHTVLVDSLEAHTTYQYKVGLSFGQGTTWSDEFTTRTPPARGAQGFSYLFFGDQGVNPDLAGSWNKAILDNADAVAVHHVGDLAYGRGAAHVWQAWMDQIAPYSRRFPLMIAVGNHEYDHMSGGEGGKDPSGVKTPGSFSPAWGNFGEDSGGECGVPTAKRFLMPPSDDSNGVFWYSYDMGNVHTTVISSEHDLARGSAQHTWLENDLSQVNRTVTPWLVLETHRPLYESQKVWAQNAVGIGMRFEMEDLLVDYQVDLVLGGHYHAYHRTCDGLYRSRCNSGGPMHITVGSAGAAFEESELFDNAWTESFQKGTYGYGRFTVHNASVMEFEFVAVDPFNATNTIAMDSVSIQRSR